VYADIHYVKQTASGMGDCSSWENACTLQTALVSSSSGSEIWVAAGTYKPITIPDRNATFQLVNGVAVYGGFAGDESQRGDRHGGASVLSGDIDNNDSQTPIITNLATVTGNTTNSYHVVTGATGATFDGFTITAGYANSATFPNERGGGMYNGNSSPTVANVTFRGNFASTSGEWRTTKAARRSRTSPSAATAPTGGVGWITTGAAIHRLRRSPSPATRQPMMAAG
jgi:hypothetical protein